MLEIREDDNNKPPPNDNKTNYVFSRHTYTHMDDQICELEITHFTYLTLWGVFLPHRISILDARHRKII